MGGNFEVDALQTLANKGPEAMDTNVDNRHKCGTPLRDRNMQKRLEREEGWKDSLPFLPSRLTHKSADYAKIYLRSRSNRVITRFCKSRWNRNPRRCLDWNDPTTSGFMPPYFDNSPEGRTMNPVETISSEELELLKAADTPTICNVIELFDGRPRNAGYMDARIQACFPEMPPMVGYATTATLSTGSPPREGDTYAGMDGQIAQLDLIPEPRVVVFQDLDVPSAAATFGEVMCMTYQTFGCVGLITSGTGRDLDQVREINFPTFTDGTICSHGYHQITDVNVPVHVGGITVYPGDLIHGDCNGVTTIPNHIAGGVARLCAEYIEAEGYVLDFLKTGKRDLEGLRAARAACAEKFAELRKRALDSL